MSLNRTLVALIASVTATGCASPLLPPVHAGWYAQGPESQVVLERRIALKLLDQGAAVKVRYTESRLIRQATQITLRVPTGPGHQVQAIEADWRTLNGDPVRLDRNHFAPVDRSDRPLPGSATPAYLAHRLSVPAGVLLRWTWVGVQRPPTELPELDLSGPYPVEKAELRITGRGAAGLEIKVQELAPAIIATDEMQVATWTKLQPSAAHPYAPGLLGKRRAYVTWKASPHPHLIERLVATAAPDYQLKTLPMSQARPSSTPCLLRPWGADTLRADQVVLSTVTQRPEGGYDLHLPDAYRRPFRDCTLIQPGPLAQVPVTHDSGTRLLRIRTSVTTQGVVEGRGQMIFSGAGARLARQGALDMTTELLEALQPLRQHLKIGAAQLSGAGPVHLPFTLRMRVSELNPSRWLGTPYPKLNYLNATEVFGPRIEQRRIEWVFDWPQSVRLPPPTRVESISVGPLQGSVTWSLGPQRTLRFVHSMTWRKQPMQVDPNRLRASVQQLIVPGLPLPK
jgi:hypothetical protein